MMETKFKNSEVGSIPKDWKYVEIGDISTLIQTGPFGSQLHQSDYITVGTPVVMPKDLVDGRISDTSIACVSKENVERLKRHKIKEGDFLFARRGDVGRCALTSEKEVGWLCGTGCFRVSIDKKKCDINYLYYQLQRKETVEWIVSKAIGSTMLNLNTSILSQVPFVQPELLTEQSRIATALSDIDDLIATTKKLIEKKRNIKEGAMQELLSGKIRLPGFKEKWVKTTLGEICQITMGQSPESKYYNTKGDGLPLIQGNADLDNRKSIIRFYSSCYSKCCDAGDIIMSVRAPVGSIGRAQYKSCLGRGVCGLKYDNDFLYYYLVSIENTWSASSTGSIFESINSKELSETVISIPHTKEEQIAIAEILSDMDSEISSLESRLAKYQSLKQGMMQQLLTGKIRLI